MSTELEKPKRRSRRNHFLKPRRKADRLDADTAAFLIDTLGEMMASEEKALLELSKKRRSK